MTQERFWFVDQLRPGTSLHNLAFGLDITGALDTGSVESALTEIVLRHEVLRTRFDMRAGRLTQRFAPDGAGVLSTHEVPDENELARLTSALAHEPFGYHAGPMLRVALLRVTPERHRLVLVAHHAIFDGWSLGVFLAEFGECYRAGVAGRVAVLPDLAVQYGDYAVWQREAHDSGAFEPDLAYWTEQIGDGCPPLELVTDFPRPGRQRMSGGSHRFTVPAKLADRLRRLAIEESATPFMAWLALYELLLHRHTGQLDFLVGGPVFNRPDERFERLLGPFINVLPFRADLGGDPTFRELLGRTRVTVTDALAHQELPLQTLTDRLAPAGPLFRVALAFQPFSGGGFELADGLSVRAFPVDVAHAQDDLSLFLTPGAAGIDALVRYDTDLFRHDTVAELCADLLTVAQRVIREPDLPVARLRATAPAHSVPRARTELFPLARQQLRWWSAEQERPGDPAWKIASTVRGRFEPATVDKAVRELGERHEVLRTRATVTDGEPRLRVVASGGPVLREHGRDDEPDTVIATVAAAPVDLTTDPPVTVDLIPDGDESVLLVTSHRFAVDRASHHLLLRDLLGDAAGEQGPEFVDYALWQREQRADIEFWRDVLAGAPPLINLPGRSAGVVASATRVTHQSARAPMTPLDELCRQENVPLEAVVLAAFAVALARHTHQQDLVIGAEVRDTVAAGTVGCFADLLPIRVLVRPHETFRELVRSTATRYLAAVEHRVVPADLAPSPRVVVRSVESPPGDATELTGHADVDVALDIAPDTAQLDCTLRCRTGTVVAPQLGSSVGHLLTEFGARPDQPVTAVPTLPPAEHRALLAELVTPDLAGAEATLHGRFEECAARLPEAVALSDDRRQWTYRELNEWANRIAHGLAGSGVAAGQPVALLMRNGPVAVAALLGVLKAGAVFVCLDPRNPAARVREFLTDIDPALVLLDPATAVEHAVPGALVLVADGRHEGHDFADQPSTDPARGIGPADPAYLAYTSGSTGKPKGIPHRHRDLTQFVGWQSDQFGIGPGERVGQLASLSFDVAYCEVFGALCHGATLCTRPPDGVVDPVVVGEWLHDQRITLLQIIPRLFAEVLRALDTRGRTEQWLADLRTVMFVGEALPAGLVNSLRERLGDRVHPVNVYGPTEVVAATFDVVGRLPAGPSTVPIGRPIPGRHLALLDEDGHLCPRGVTGEIWIGSRYLSSGYHRDPAQTGERYAPSPFSELPGVLYRTGDLAVLRSDGLLEFAGRTDNQVKLSGIRLELEDVEAAVARHPHVLECAARVLDRAGAQRLVAYVVADGSDSAVDDLREFLRGTVPAHMIPAEVLSLPALPRGVNGKIDRAALPEPPAAGQSAGAVAPRTPLEQHLAELAADVLGVDTVGVTTNLFDLGGNSLQAARFVNRIDELYGVTISLQDLFDGPTVAAAAVAVETGRYLMGHEERLTAIENDLDRLSDDEIRTLLADRRDRPITS